MKLQITNSNPQNIDNHYQIMTLYLQLIWAHSLFSHLVAADWIISSPNLRFDWVMTMSLVPSFLEHSVDCCVLLMQAGFYRIDHDYVANSAQLAKKGGCSQFHLVSSGSANKNSSFLYARTKVCSLLFITEACSAKLTFCKGVNWCYLIWCFDLNFWLKLLYNIVLTELRGK